MRQHLFDARSMCSGAAQAEEEDMLNPLASDMSEPASMGRRRSGRFEERVSFVSGRGSWHPTSGPDTNGTVLATPCFLKDEQKKSRTCWGMVVRQLHGWSMCTGHCQGCYLVGFLFGHKGPHKSVHGR